MCRLSGLWIAAVVLFVAGMAQCAAATETEHLDFQILPAPAKVVVDGKADDWDLSAGILACGDAETQRETYAIWFYAMYDQQNVYFLARWIDPTPLNNPGRTIGDFGFSGDCLQVRIMTNPGTPASVNVTLNCWMGSDGKDVVELAGGKIPKGKDIKPRGAQQATWLCGLLSPC